MLPDEHQFEQLDDNRQKMSEHDGSTINEAWSSNDDLDYMSDDMKSDSVQLESEIDLLDLTEAPIINWPLRTNECIQKLMTQSDTLLTCFENLNRGEEIKKSHIASIKAFQSFISLFNSKKTGHAITKHSKEFEDAITAATETKSSHMLNQALSLSLFQELAFERAENIRLRSLLHQWDSTTTQQQNQPSNDDEDAELQPVCISTLNSEILDGFDTLRGNARLFDEFCERQNQHVLHYNLNKFLQQLNELESKDRQRKKLVDLKLKQSIDLNDTMKIHTMKVSADKAALIMQHKSLIEQLNAMNHKLHQMATESSKYKHASTFLRQKINKKTNPTQSSVREELDQRDRMQTASVPPRPAPKKRRSPGLLRPHTTKQPTRTPPKTATHLQPLIISASSKTV